MSIQVTFPDGAVRDYAQGTTGTTVVESISTSLAKKTVAMKWNGVLTDLSDPLSEDGKWRLIKPDPQTIAAFAKRVQDYNNGLLPSNPTQLLDRYSIVIVNSIDTNSEEDLTEPEDYELVTDNAPFIGVASQSKARSVITYYGIENHSKWVFTPLFRGGGGPTPPGPRGGRPQGAPPPPNR